MADAAQTIMIVDGSADYADNLREILEGAGYRVRLSASRAQALEQASAESFTVALIDVMLPDGDGASLAKSLKQRRPGSEVILLTGFPAERSHYSPVKDGVRAYLPKPCSPEYLLCTIDEAIRHAALREENQQLAQRVAIAEKLTAVGTLTTGLSHEIRNPLNAATLHLTLLERRIRRIPTELQPDLISSLSTARDELRRLTDLVQDFLQFARPQAITPSPVDLTAVAESVRILLLPQAKEAGISLHSRYAPARMVAGDADALKQAILNLVINAIQAVPSGGQVTLEIGDEGSEVSLAVTDTGPGIPNVLKSRIFEPFFTTKPTGSGLGLPIVYSIIRCHGGGLILEDVPTSGARFVMRLPAMEPESG